MPYVAIIFLGIALALFGADQRRRNGINEPLEESLKSVTLPGFGVAGAAVQALASFWFTIALNLDPQGPSQLQAVGARYMIPGGSVNTLQVPIVLGTLALLYAATAAFRRSLKP